MAAGYRLTGPALHDLREIATYIHQQSGIRRVEQIEARMLEVFANLAKHPGLGHFRRDLTKREVRFFGVYQWLVMYDPQTMPLDILAVLHGKRDLRQLLRHR